jgi:hypothetical protein
MSHSTHERRLAPILVGAPLSALLGGSALAHYLPGFAAAGFVFITSVIVALLAPSKAKAWRRLLLLAALFSFASAWAVWSAVAMGAPELIQSHRVENALGISFLVMIGSLVLLGLGPAFFIGLGLILAAIAWIAGRAP